jgi:hypothetical protein
MAMIAYTANYAICVSYNTGTYVQTRPNRDNIGPKLYSQTNSVFSGPKHHDGPEYAK